MNVIPVNLLNIPEAQISSAVNTWHPFFGLPIEAVDFLRHFACCRGNNEPIDRRFWEAALISILRDEKFHLSLATGHILHSYFAEIPEGMVRCVGCGDVWDGCRQCDCEGIQDVFTLYPDN